MNPIQAMAMAHAFGVSINLQGDHLLLQAATAPPSLVIDTLARNKGPIMAILLSGDGVRDGALCRFMGQPANDDCEERSAIIEHDGRVPRKWAEAYAWLLCSPRPEHVAKMRWRRALDDAGRLVDLWVPSLSAMGWDEGSVFGSSLTSVRKSLIFELNGREVAAVARNAVIVKSTEGRTEAIERQFDDLNAATARGQNGRSG